MPEGDVKLNLKYFINSAMEKKIPWNLLTFFLNDLAPTLEKSREVVEILVKELEKLTLKLEESLIEGNEEHEFVNIEAKKNFDQDDFEILTGFENKYYTFVGEPRESRSKQQDTGKDEDFGGQVLEEKHSSDVSESDDVVESFSEDNEEFNLPENDEVVESLVQEPTTESSKIQSNQASQVAMESEQNEELENEFYVFIGDESDSKAKEQEIDINNSLNQKVSKCKEAFECSICFKNFTCKKNLKAHTRIHTGEKQFQCMQCGNCFHYRSTLIRHRKTHSETTPFQCNACSKSFTQSSDMQRHERIHTGEKPFKCKTCPKSFTQPNNLARHEMIHSGERPFKCKNCTKCFNQRSHLSKHEKNQHS